MGGPVQLALALLAVVALIAVARMMGFVARPSLADADEAVALASALPGGFAPVRVELATDRSGAVLRDAAGRIAVVAPFGAHFLARLDEGAWSARVDPAEQLAISGPGFACALPLGPVAGQWCEAINTARAA